MVEKSGTGNWADVLWLEMETLKNHPHELTRFRESLAAELPNFIQALAREARGLPPERAAVEYLFHTEWNRESGEDDERPTAAGGDRSNQ